MDQFEVMSELFADRSNWLDVRHYPSTVICRRMLRLADFAAADPARWGSCRLAFEVPELSRPELAVARGISVRTLQRHLAQQDLSDAGDFTESELDGERPEWLRAVSIRFEAGCTSRTYRYATALCTFAAAQPERWRQPSGRNHSWDIPVTSMSFSAMRSSVFVNIRYASGRRVSGSESRRLTRILTPLRSLTPSGQKGCVMEQYDYNRGRADGARQMLEFIRGEDLALRQQGKAGGIEVAERAAAAVIRNAQQNQMEV